MPSIDKTPNIEGDYMVGDQGSGDVTYNQALNILDTLVQMMLKSISTTTPPGAPDDGDRYYIPAGADPPWDANIGKIATWRESQYQYDDTKLGYRAWVEDLAMMMYYNGSSWQANSGANKFIHGHFGVALGAASIATAGVAHPGVLTTVAGGSYAEAGVPIPSDFGTLVSAIIIGHGNGTGGTSGNLDVEVEYNADDEPPGEHSASSTSIPYSISNNSNQFRADITSLLGSLAADDLLGVNARRQTGLNAAHMNELLIEYTPA